mmetsp:Transcript_52512/g.145248  ORF Transcript_52512/g.145248 Transcript_52512/m.145248 type:complete len:278 (-) Transcript_52512:799-1632(-)
MPLRRARARRGCRSNGCARGAPSRRHDARCSRSDGGGVAEGHRWHGAVRRAAPPPEGSRVAAGVARGPSARRVLWRRVPAAGGELHRLELHHQGGLRRAAVDAPTPRSRVAHGAPGARRHGRAPLAPQQARWHVGQLPLLPCPAGGLGRGDVGGAQDDGRVLAEALRPAGQRPRGAFLPDARALARSGGRASSASRYGQHVEWSDARPDGMPRGSGPERSVLWRRQPEQLGRRAATNGRRNADAGALKPSRVQALRAAARHPLALSSAAVDVVAARF